jgi:hypothetical protein
MSDMAIHFAAIRPPALFGGEPYRNHDLGIGGAATEISAEVVLDLLIGGVGMLVEQLRHHHDETRRAIAALERRGLDERLLHRAELLWSIEALHRDDLGTIDELGEVEAAGYRQAIDQYGAATAQPLAAAFARAGEPELVLQQLD